MTSFPLDVDNLRWSPAGSYIVSSGAEVYPDADMAATARRDKVKADDPVKAMKFDRLFIRHWDTWADGKRNHIFVHARATGARAATWKAAGEPIDLMKAVDADCLSKPFGGRRGAAGTRRPGDRLHRSVGQRHCVVNGLQCLYGEHRWRPCEIDHRHEQGDRHVTPLPTKTIAYRAMLARF